MINISFLVNFNLHTNCLRHKNMSTHHSGYIVRMMPTMMLPGKSKRGRPKRRFVDAIREDVSQRGSERKTPSRSEDRGRQWHGAV